VSRLLASREAVKSSDCNARRDRLTDDDDSHQIIHPSNECQHSLTTSTRDITVNTVISLDVDVDAAREDVPSRDLPSLWLPVASIEYSLQTI
jgi:hypothetical protein